MVRLSLTKSEVLYLASLVSSDVLEMSKKGGQKKLSYYVAESVLEKLGKAK